MKSQDFFYQHGVEHLARRIKRSGGVAAAVAEYIALTGCIEPKIALKLAAQNSPSTQKIIEILKLDEDREAEEAPEKIDEGQVKQHDYKSQIQYAPPFEPIAPNNLFSVPVGDPMVATQTAVASTRSTNKTANKLCMLPLSKTAITINTIEISPEEKEQATITRKKFEDMLDKMNQAFEHLGLLNGSLTGITDPKSLEPLRKLFKQFKRKMQRMFNEFIDALELALQESNKTVTDSEMDRIVDTVVAEVREIRDGAEKLLVYLKEPQESDFVKNFTATVERLNARRESLTEIVTDQLFVHVDEDVLNKVRLG